MDCPHGSGKGGTKRMIQIVTADGAAEYALLEKLAARSGETNRQAEIKVREIIDTVRAGGDAAVCAYTKQFDGVDAPLQAFDREQLRQIAAECDAAVYGALQRAADNIADFHRRQLQQSWLTTREDGTLLGQRVRGLTRVGLYVPGGTAAYPSSVLMNAIPARIAGVTKPRSALVPCQSGNHLRDGGRAKPEHA